MSPSSVFGCLMLVLIFLVFEARGAVVNFFRAPAVAVAPVAVAAPTAVIDASPGFITNNAGSGGRGNQVCIGGTCFPAASPTSASASSLICNSGACIPSTTRFNNPSGNNFTYTGLTMNNLYCPSPSFCYVLNGNSGNSGSSSSSGLSSSSGTLINTPTFGSSSYSYSTSNCNSGSSIGTVSATNAAGYDIGGGPFQIGSNGQITANTQLSSGTYSAVVTAYDNSLFGVATSTISVTANCASSGGTATCIFNGVLCYTTG